MPALIEELHSYGAKVFFQLAVSDVQVHMSHEIKNLDELKADSVVNAAGFIPNKSLLSGRKKHVHYIGDADTLSNLKGAIWGANDLVVKLSK